MCNLNKAWEDCAGFDIWSGDNYGYEFVITCCRTSARETVRKCTTLNVANCTCEYGKWQDNGYPCACNDAMAYFWLRKKCSLMHVIADYISVYYWHKEEYKMTKENLQHPVCMEAMAPVGETLLPYPNAKSMSGRPKKKRFLQATLHSMCPRRRINCEQQESKKGHGRESKKTKDNSMAERGPGNVANKNNLDLL